MQQGKKFKVNPQEQYIHLKAWLPQENNHQRMIKSKKHKPNKYIRK